MTGNTAVDVFIVLGAIAAGLGLFGVLGRGGRWIWRLFTSLDDFIDDWKGSPARDGVPERPGVLKRITAIEERVSTIERQGTAIERQGTAIEQRVSTIEHEVRTNDGSSLKDSVQRIERFVSGGGSA
jgi:hypothetical protein